MKTFFYFFILFSFFYLFIQSFFLNKIAKGNSKFLNYAASPVYSLCQPFRSTFYAEFNEFNYSKSPLFFFSNFDITKFYFHVDSSFSLHNFFLNKYSFPVPLPIFRVNFVNYSLSHVNICRYYKFSENDFKDLTFSNNFSIVFGSFSIISYSSGSSHSSFTNSCRYNFTFSISDFSITLYIQSYNNIIIPVSFIKLSVKDYKFLVSLLNAFNYELNTLNVFHLSTIFAKFFCSVFNLFLIPSSDFISLGSKKYPHMFIKNAVYSNIDSHHFGQQDVPIEYYTFYSTPKDYTNFPNIFTIRAFSFFRL